MHFASYLQSAKTILNSYDGAMPFAAWLKQYFRQHKKFGSKDRKLVADLCFCYYRLGGAFIHFGVEDRLLIGQFLCAEESAFIKELKPEWKEKSTLKIKDKIAFLDASQVNNIFPFADELSNEIDKETFQLSFLIQPDLFLRLRPGKEKSAVEKLSKAAIAFEQEGSCLRLPINTKIDEIISLDEEAVVQDISSQKVLRPLLQQPQTTNHKPQTFVWDCCAASGGKSILFHDIYPEAKLTVSDIRESIIPNLKNRFKRAGIQQFQSFVADVSSPGFSLHKKFDVILCDAPCSGSGTWSRTSEQLTFFKKEKIDYYANLQKKIAVNAGKCLKKGGLFLYITCSVFKKENEDVVHYLQQHANLKILSQQYFKGYDKKGDTLFVALLVSL